MQLEKKLKHKELTEKLKADKINYNCSDLLNVISVQNG